MGAIIMPIFKFTQVSGVPSLCLYSLLLKILIRSVILAHQKFFFFSPSYTCCLPAALNNELCLQRHSVALEVTWAYVQCGCLDTVGIRGALVQLCKFHPESDAHREAPEEVQALQLKQDVPEWPVKTFASCLFYLNSCEYKKMPFITCLTASCLAKKVVQPFHRHLTASRLGLV